MKKFILFLVVPTILLLLSCATTPKNADPASPPPISTTAEPIEIGADDFKTKIADYTDKEWKYLGDKPAVVDFYATWCGPCKKLSPILSEMAIKYDGKVIFYKLDVDKAPEVANAFGIESIPAVYYIPMTGKPAIQIGLYPKDAIEAQIKKLLAN